MQKIEDICVFKHRKDLEAGTPIAAKNMAALYKDHLEQDEGEPRSSISTIDAALTVSEKMLKHREIKSMSNVLEEECMIITFCST